MKYFVHDFLFEETGESNTKDCFFFHITVYCTHNKELLPDQKPEKLFLGVGNAAGIARQMTGLQEIFYSTNEKKIFCGPFMLLNDFDDDIIMRHLKEKIESFHGVNKRELLYTLTPFFEWEHLSDPDIVRELFK